MVISSVKIRFLFNFFLNPDAIFHYFFQIIDNGRWITFVFLHPFEDFPDLRYDLGQFLFPCFLLLKWPHFTRIMGIGGSRIFISWFSTAP